MTLNLTLNIKLADYATTCSYWLGMTNGKITLLFNKILTGLMKQLEKKIKAKLKLFKIRDQSYRHFLFDIYNYIYVYFGLALIVLELYILLRRWMLVMIDHHQLLELKFLMLFRWTQSQLTWGQSVWLVFFHILCFKIFIVCAHDEN